jgi:hypothetical protein
MAAMDGADAGAAKPARLAGLALILAACASVALLLLHPDENAANFAGVLKNEASGRALSALVHGGMIVVLVAELAALAILVARAAEPAAIAGYVFFAAGATFLSASLVTDGLVIPAIAAKYAAAPAAKLDYAKALFVLCGSAVRVLMPMGLAFLAAGISGLGAALWSGSRALGAAGVALGILIMAAIAATVTTLNPFVIMGALAGLTLWLACLGVFAMRGRI